MPTMKSGDILHKDKETSIRTHRSESETWVEIKGPMNDKSWKIVQTEFDGLVKTDKNNVILEMSGVTMISGSGVAKIVRLCKKLKAQRRQVTLHGVNDKLHLLFTSINLDKLANVVRDNTSESQNSGLHQAR